MKPIENPVQWQCTSTTSKLPYDTKLNTEMETSFQRYSNFSKVSNNLVMFNFELKKALYSLDFSRMVQINLVTKKERKVERVINYCWKWKGKRWYAFDYNSSLMIETNMMKHRTTFPLQVDGRTYNINLTTMQQFNSKTNRGREIKRFTSETIPRRPDMNQPQPQRAPLILSNSQNYHDDLDQEESDESDDGYQSIMKKDEWGKSQAFTDSEPKPSPVLSSQDRSPLKPRPEKDTFAEYYMRNKSKEPLATILKTHCQWEWNDVEFQGYMSYWEEALKM